MRSLESEGSPAVSSNRTDVGSACRGRSSAPVCRPCPAPPFRQAAERVVASHAWPAVFRGPGQHTLVTKLVAALRMH